MAKRRKRKQHVSVKAEEERKLRENFQRIKSLTGGFSRSGTSLASSKASTLLQPRVYRRQTGWENLPSFTVNKVIDDVPRKVILSPEMAERERLAQIEIERKKKRVGVLYNKGGLMYITDGTDLKELGKK